MTTNGTVLVLGGTGKTGRRVVERLQARGLAVRIGSRSGAPPFDWEDPATWAPALEGVGAVVRLLLPRHRRARRRRRRSRSFAELARRSRASGGSCCSPAAARRRRSAPSRRCGTPALDWTIVRCDLVQPELQRGLPARADPRRRGRAPGRRHARAVRRRRRHRRRRRRRADRGRAHRPALRADRPAAADLRRGGRRDRRGDRPRASRYVPVSVEEYAAAAAEHGVPPRTCRPADATCSARSSTGATPRSPTASSGRSGREPRDFARLRARHRRHRRLEPLAGDIVAACPPT